MILNNIMCRKWRRCWLPWTTFHLSSSLLMFPTSSSWTESMMWSCPCPLKDCGRLCHTHGSICWYLAQRFRTLMSKSSSSLSAKTSVAQFLSILWTNTSKYVCMISWCLSTKGRNFLLSCKILFEDPGFSNFWKTLNSSTWACIFGLMVFTMFDISTCTYMRELFYADGTSVPVQCFQMKMCSILLLCCEMLFHQQALVWAWKAR